MQDKRILLSKIFLTLCVSKPTIKTVNVSEKGQIVIPKEIQNSLGIKKGDRLVITTKNKKILIQKAENIEKQMGDDFADLIKFSELSLNKLWSNKKDDEIWNRYLQ